MAALDETVFARLCRRRFRSFSEAAGEVLEALQEVVPGVIVVGRLDIDTRAHQVIDVRGQGQLGITRGAMLPLAGDGLNGEFLRSLGAGAWIDVALEKSDGSIAGVLCAIDRRADAYGPEQEAALVVAARLLGNEWESVELRSEVRRLRRQLNAGPTMDSDTGLPNRDGFLELLDHEWRLVERGTVESVLVACDVGPRGDEDGSRGNGAKARLALKLAAEVLEGSIRATDRIGRVRDETLATVLVGCPLADAPAFVARFLGALDRVTDGQPPVEISCGVQPLADTSAPEESLALAIAAAHESGRNRRVLAPEPVVE